MEKSLELCFSSNFDLIQSFAEVLDRLSEVHQSSQDESPIEIVETIVRFHGDGFVELSKRIVYLVEHHHAVTSVGIVLCILLVKTNGSPKIVHRFLVVSNRHESLSSFTVVLRMR